jgi:multidrug resistance efflux pump
MAHPRLLTLGITLAVVGASLGAGLWLADQAAFVITSNARVLARMVTLSHEIAGQIIDMPVNAGDRIKRRDVLARLDNKKGKTGAGQCNA